MRPACCPGCGNTVHHPEKKGHTWFLECLDCGGRFRIFGWPKQNKVVAPTSPKEGEGK